jgi:hypothetical protein
MPVEERLQQAAASLRGGLLRRPVPDPPTQGKRRLMPAVLAASVAVVSIVVLMMAIPGEPDPALLPPADPTSTSTSVAVPSGLVVPETGPIFGEETGVLLLYDDGLEGLIAIDPDRRLGSRLLLAGQRPGDEPYSMVRVGDHLVVGWGEPHAVEISTLESTSLGQALIFLPGPEDDRVWMIQDPWDTPTVWQVGLDGQTLTEPTGTPAGMEPRIGVTGGLALTAEDGVVLWDSASGESREVKGTGHGIPLDSTSSRLLWCSDPCTELTLTDTETLESETFQPPTGYVRFEHGRDSRHLTEDGDHLAVVVESADGGRALWVHDVESGESAVLADPETSVYHVTWSPKEDQVFASSYSYGERSTTIWRYDVASGELTSVTIPVSGSLTLAVVDSQHSPVYIPPGADTIPSGRCGSGMTCVFDF